MIKKLKSKTKKIEKVKKVKVIDRFPKRELNQWLKNRSVWNHDDWLGLLDDLRSQGFVKWTENQEGQNTIGAYLEETRS